MQRIRLKNGLVAYKTTTEEICDIGGLGICDDCGTYHPEGGYLVPVLNHWMCEDCFKDWARRARRYPEDDEIEQRRIEYYESILNVENET